MHEKGCDKRPKTIVISGNEDKELLRPKTLLCKNFFIQVVFAEDNLAQKVLKFIILNVWTSSRMMNSSGVQIQKTGEYLLNFHLKKSNSSTQRTIGIMKRLKSFIRWPLQSTEIKA